MSFPYPALSSDFSSKPLNPILASYLNIISHLESYPHIEPPFTAQERENFSCPKTITNRSSSCSSRTQKVLRVVLIFRVQPAAAQHIAYVVREDITCKPSATKHTSLHEAPRADFLLPSHTHTSCLHNYINTNLSEDDAEWLSFPKCKTGV